MASASRVQGQMASDTRQSSSNMVILEMSHQCLDKMSHHVSCHTMCLYKNDMAIAGCCHTLIVSMNILAIFNFFAACHGAESYDHPLQNYDVVSSFQKASAL